MTGGFHSGHLWLYFVGLKRPALLSHYPLRWTVVSRLWWMTAQLLFSLLWPPQMLVSLCLFPTHLTQNVSRMYRLPAGILSSWILRHSPSILQRKVASWVRRVYSFTAVKRMRGSGGQKGLWGILLFAFNLELSAVAWETKPKKNIYLFFFFFFACIFKSSSGRTCFWVERKPFGSEGPVTWGLLSAHPSSAYHGYFLSPCWSTRTCICEKQQQKRLNCSSLVVGVKRHQKAAERRQQCSRKTCSWNMALIGNLGCALGLCVTSKPPRLRRYS